MKHVKIGGLDVARIGLGAMGMSTAYTGAGSDDDESVRTIHRAIDLGVTLIDTAEVYGPYVNEELVGRALKGHRDQVVLATKFGMISHTGGTGLDSSPASITKAVEGSLRRLGVDHIDLYYQHRVDPGTPIEDVIGALAGLVEAARSVTSACRRPAPRRSAAPTPFYRPARCRRLSPRQPALHRRQLHPQPSQRPRGRDDRSPGRCDARTGRARLAAHPRRGYRPHPRHQARHAAGGERRRRHGRAHPRADRPARRPHPGCGRPP